jgi:hypothetical protein
MGDISDMLKRVPGTPFVDFKPDPVIETGAELLAFMEGPLRKFTAKVEAVLAGYDRRLAALEAARVTDGGGQDLDCI